MYLSNSSKYVFSLFYKQQLLKETEYSMSIGRYYRDNHGLLTLLTVLAMVTRFTIAAKASWKIEAGGTVLAWFVDTFVDVYMNKSNCH